MLKTPLIHPDILSALARAGHGSLVLVADGNFPAGTTAGPNTTVVHLNLLPGTVDAVTVVSAIAGAVPLEEAFVMAPMSDGPYALAGDPPIWAEFASALSANGSPLPLQPVERTAFYKLAATTDVALTVVSGDVRLYGNVLLRIGVEPGRDNTPSRGDAAWH